mmetsp:Transcript_18248/g.21824  ORF Transcript_18248/g.21824 Transcript_18248/m.21824 type:complete len:210 (+) Transcript_18248:231-860(+)
MRLYSAMLLALGIFATACDAKLTNGKGGLVSKSAISKSGSKTSKKAKSTKSTKKSKSLSPSLILSTLPSASPKPSKLPSVPPTISSNPTKLPTILPTISSKPSTSPTPKECDDYGTKRECSKHKCKWGDSEGNKSCREDCFAYEDKGDCPVNKCEWRKNIKGRNRTKCRNQKECANYKPPGVCPTNRCEWRGVFGKENGQKFCKNPIDI